MSADLAHKNAQITMSGYRLFQQRYSRLIFVVVIGAFNSEVLFGHLTIRAFLLDPWIWLAYAPLLIVCDHLIQRNSLRRLEVLLIGLSFGLYLETVITGMIAEGLLMLTFISLWHAIFTVFLTQSMANFIWPRPVNNSPPKIITGSITLGVIVSCLFLLQTAPVLLAVGWQSILIFLVIAGSIGWCLRRKKILTEENIYPSLRKTVLLTTTAFILGIFVSIIEASEADPAWDYYGPYDHALRAILYAGLLGWIFMSHKKPDFDRQKP